MAVLPAWAQVEVGVAEWTHPSAFGTDQNDEVKRPIVQFGALKRDERIRTDERGAVDIVFERGSRLLVGPRCELVLDETYYDARLDNVVSFDMYSQTVCIVRGGADAETVELRTPLANVVIKDVSATIVYFGANENGAKASLGSPPVQTPGSVGDTLLASAFGRLQGERLVVYLNHGLGKNGFVEVSGNSRKSVLRRPGFVIRAGAAVGVLPPERGNPLELGTISAAIEEAGSEPTDADRFDDRETQLSFAELEQVIQRQAASGIGRNLGCAISAYCDAAPTAFGGGLSLTFP